MAERLVIQISDFDHKQQQICLGCTAEVHGTCKLAELQMAYKFRPTTYQAAQAGIDYSNVPSTCPNGYKQPDPQEF